MSMCFLRVRKLKFMISVGWCNRWCVKCVCVVLCGCVHLNVFSISFQPFLIPIKKFALHTEYFANPGVVLPITASQNLTFNYKIKNVICFNRSLAYRVEGIYLNNASSDSRSFLNLTCRLRTFVNPELASQNDVKSCVHLSCCRTN